MEIDISTSVFSPINKPHPSSLQRKKLKEDQEKRRAKALRENLLKRKEQVRSREKTKV